ncbi:DUF397 domain-containing protein [Spirillospora sp. NPDC029432]|uniref:DUF397 domain-containing protein n=1 Tax=Spirillospora sp. NPDC029432 TaxID=3154599 RepID=UPI003454C051
MEELNEVIWRKARRSYDDGDQCVEVASLAGGVAFRDSKDPAGPKVTIERVRFRRLIEVMKQAE